MKQLCYILMLSLSCAAWAQSTPDNTPAKVSGDIHAGISTQLNTDLDQTSLQYETNDPRLGTNSGNRYLSEVNDVSQNIHALYGTELNLLLHPQHSLRLTLDGTNDIEHAMGSRTEQLLDKEGKQISSVSGQYNHPNERANHLNTTLDYTYRLRRPGSSLVIGYGYRWDNEKGGWQQQTDAGSNGALYRQNLLEQNINYHYHHAHLDYVLPVAKGHLLDWGLAYDRRSLSVRSEQDWDEVRILDAHYQHLTQYGGLHARYRLKAGPVEAMARLEYRATRMQERWLHDVLPTATIRYHIDTTHSLSAFYTIMLIRPEVQHLDTNRISDTYTTSYGNDKVIGVHVHNVALTYAAHTQHADASLEVRYLTANDGFNAIWMEREGRRIYTWGNEGVRHAIGVTPSVDAQLSSTTRLHASATVMWDKRVAAAINLANANWGIRADARLTQQLFAASIQQPALAGQSVRLNLLIHGDYGYHNTLDVYSYAGHGGSVGADLQLHLPLTHARQSLQFAIGYTCQMKPDIHIIQGAYTGIMAYQPGATHIAMARLAYRF